MDPSNILIWNVRGLNSTARRDAVRVVVESSKIDVVCLQETKMASFSRQIILSMLGTDFDNNFCFSPSAGASGGILVAWRSRLGPVGGSRVDHHCVSVQFCPIMVLLGGLPVFMDLKETRKKFSFYRNSGIPVLIALAHGWLREISILSIGMRTKIMPT